MPVLRAPIHRLPELVLVPLGPLLALVPLVPVRALAEQILQVPPVEAPVPELAELGLARLPLPLPQQYSGLLEGQPLPRVPLVAMAPPEPGLGQPAHRRPDRRPGLRSVDWKSVQRQQGRRRKGQ